MNLGAMIDLGIEEEYLRSELNKINLEGWELKTERDQRHGIFGTRATVIQTREEHIHRHPADIEKIISSSSLSERVKTISSKIFREIALAESKVHDIPYEKVHFHEVGAIDSIIDIVGAAICFDKIGVEQVYISTVELGGGTVKCAHGLLPVPAPATAEILLGIPVSAGGVNFEATTPTGAAIVKALGTSFGKYSDINIIKTGYGIGQKESPERPNILRLFLAEKSEAISDGHTAFMIECNIDDMNPEWYENLMFKLFEAGASDVFYTDIIMKRGRPAMKVSIVCDREKIETLRSILFSESTTLGLRISEFEKFTLHREFREIETRFGKIGVKYSYYDGKIVSVKPEYNDCLKAANENNLPLKEVYSIIAKEINQ